MVNSVAGVRLRGVQWPILSGCHLFCKRVNIRMYSNTRPRGTYVKASLLVGRLVEVDLADCTNFALRHGC
jgi:hypothetical protein